MLLASIERINFKKVVLGHGIEDELKQKHYIVIAIEETLKIARCNNWPICNNNSFIYLYNGAYWKKLEEATIKDFLGKSAESLGIDLFQARFYLFKDKLFKQFLSSANLPSPERSKENVLVNLNNGTFEISTSKQHLRPFNADDFLTYQLPFDYDPNAKAPIFEQFLNKVLPDLDCQNILAEYLGYLFISNGVLKLEKALLLYGQGANGKSVFFEVVNALLGRTENVTTYSLQSLTDNTGYYRAMIANKLVNYATEISGKMDCSIFKALVSGEPIEARLPYGDPLTITEYAKFIFNCNDLPKDVEHNNAFFRRLIIIPFNVTIPEQEQDKELATKIISSELSGIFNWVLDGLNRLLKNKKFTESAIVKEQIDDYKLKSDSVKMLLDEEDLCSSLTETIPLKAVYKQYRDFCNANGYSPCSNRLFADRLRKDNIRVERRNSGNVCYLAKKTFF